VTDGGAARWWSTSSLVEHLLALGGVALEIGGFSSEDQLLYEGLRKRYRREAHFRGKTAQRNSQYAFYAIAAIRGGHQHDVGADTARWHSDLWPWLLVHSHLPHHGPNLSDRACRSIRRPCCRCHVDASGKRWDGDGMGPKAAEM
jgi:hypothetical protein